MLYFWTINLLCLLFLWSLIYTEYIPPRDISDLATRYSRMNLRTNLYQIWRRGIWERTDTQIYVRFGNKRFQKQIHTQIYTRNKNGIIKKVDNSEWASPTVYVKKKNNKIRVWRGFLNWTEWMSEGSHISTSHTGGDIFKVEWRQSLLENWFVKSLSASQSRRRMYKVSTHSHTEVYID